MTAAPDPYGVLGVAATASDAELRGAYRRLVQRHHPDHNGGSPESAVRFAEVQEAYAHVRLLRRTPGPAAASATSGEPSAAPGTGDPGLDARLAALERELGEARARREKAARRAARLRPRERPSTAPRPSDAELGYVRTQDSFGKILDDFADEVNARVSEAQDARRANQTGDAPRRARGVADWIDELGARLTGDHEHDHERDDDAGSGRSGGANA